MNRFKSFKKTFIVVLIMNLLISQSFFALPGAAAEIYYNKLPEDRISKIQALSGGSKDFKAGEILLKVKGGLLEENRILRKYRMDLVQRVPRTDYVLASYKNKNFDNALKKLQQEDSVLHAQPNYIYRTLGFPNDPQFTRQWALKNINGTKTLNSASAGRGASPVIVAVLDTGVDVNHPDLKTRLVPGTNTVNPLKSSRDSNGHGTHIAGIISALTNNMTGVAGVAGTAPVKVMPVKVFEGNEGSDVSISNGIIWAVDHGAKVINMSFGSYSKSEVLNEAIDYAYKKGVVLVAAAGNWASEEVSYPAAVSRVMAVSAINDKDSLTEFSSYGPLIDICAPGEDIYSTYWDSYKGSTYTEMSGTSMASPMVAGLAALLLTKNPKLTNDEIRQIIEVSATDLGDSGWDTKYGHGKINVDKAMTISLSNIDDSNSSSGKAVYLTNGLPVKEKIDFGSDQDWFKIDVPQNGHFQVEVLPAGLVSPGVEIYNKSGKLLASFNSDSQPEKKLSLFETREQSSIKPVQYKVAEAVHGFVTNLTEGEYYIKVFGNHYRWSDREYTLTAWIITGDGLIQDANEPNNSYKKARKISTGSRFTGTISSQWDQDWFKLELPGKVYKVEAKTPKGLDLAVEIESAANYNEDSGGFDDNYADWFYQSINKAGIGSDEEEIVVLPNSRSNLYLLRVYDAGGGAYNGSYTITVSPYKLKPDTYEPNNYLNSASSVTLSQKVAGNFDNEKDVDWYSVEIADTGALGINFRQPDNVWCDVNIYNESMDIIRNDPMEFSRSNSGGFTESDLMELKYKVFPGKYYIKVSSTEKKIGGNYELNFVFSNFEFIDAEINDSPSAATPLISGEVKSGTIYPLGDIDCYELNIDKAEPYLISVSPDSEMNTIAVVMSEQNTLDERVSVFYAALGLSDSLNEDKMDFVTIIDGGGKGELDTGVFHPSRPGRYFLFISGSGKFGSKYNVSVAPFKVQPDLWEDNGTLSKARLLVPGNSVAPTFMGIEDVDWYKIYINGPGVISADLTVPHDIDGVLEIYDGSGKLLARSDQSMVGEKENLMISLRSPGYYYIKTYDYLGNSSVQTYTLDARFTASKQTIPAPAPKKLK